MLKRVEIKNYKSIAQAVVDLNQFTVLVGPNGAGKSNFLDALSFVSDCLTSSVELALNKRGGIGSVRWRSSGPRGRPTNFGMRLSMEVGPGHSSAYAFEISAVKGGVFKVKEESCVIQESLLEEKAPRFDRRDGKVVLENLRFPRDELPIETDRLALPILGAIPQFRPVYDLLAGMRFYSLAPGRIRELQQPDEGFVLKRDGSNAASVLQALERHSEDGAYQYQRICEFLSRLVPGVIKVEHRTVGPKETLRFRQKGASKGSVSFDALNMSDGTLRILGVLLAVYQPSSPSVIGIEEPESTVHPAASEAIVDVLIDASHRSQVLTATHSPEILDNKRIDVSQIKAVNWRDGKTLIGPVNEQTRQLIRDGLCTPGELLATDELVLDEEAAEETANQLDLFGFTETG